MVAQCCHMRLGAGGQGSGRKLQVATGLWWKRGAGGGPGSAAACTEFAHLTAVSPAPRPCQAVSVLKPAAGAGAAAPAVPPPAVPPVPLAWPQRACMLAGASRRPSECLTAPLALLLHRPAGAATQGGGSALRQGRPRCASLWVPQMVENPRRWQGRQRCRLLQSGGRSGTAAGRAAASRPLPAWSRAVVSMQDGLQSQTKSIPQSHDHSVRA